MTGHNSELKEYNILVPMYRQPYAAVLEVSRPTGCFLTSNSRPNTKIKIKNELPARLSPVLLYHNPQDIYTRTVDPLRLDLCVPQRASHLCTTTTEHYEKGFRKCHVEIKPPSHGGRHSSSSYYNVNSFITSPISSQKTRPPSHIHRPSP